MSVYLERPVEGGPVPLSDLDLAKIGLTTVYESMAKALAAAILRVTAGLNEQQWLQLENRPFKSILAELSVSLEQADSELQDKFGELELALKQSHELRHSIVHAIWGYGSSTESEPIGYDQRRKKWLSPSAMDEAVTGCARLKQAAHALGYCVAERIQDGLYPERTDGPGFGVRTTKRMVRL